MNASPEIENPMPALAPEGLKIAVLTPISRPAESSSGPLGLLGLLAASVWTAPLMVRSVYAAKGLDSSPMNKLSAQPGGRFCSPTPLPHGECGALGQRPRAGLVIWISEANQRESS